MHMGGLQKYMWGHLPVFSTIFSFMYLWGRAHAQYLLGPEEESVLCFNYVTHIIRFVGKSLYLLSPLSFEAESLSEPGAHQFGYIGSPASSTVCIASVDSVIGL